MKQEVAHHLGGVVPAKMFKVHEHQRSVRAAQRVVKTEIGWAQGAALDRQLRIDFETVCGKLAGGHFQRAFEHRTDRIGQEDPQFLARSGISSVCSSTQTSESDPNALCNRAQGKASLRSIAERPAGGLQLERVEANQKVHQGIDVAVRDILAGQRTSFYESKDRESLLGERRNRLGDTANLVLPEKAKGCKLTTAAIARSMRDRVSVGHGDSNPAPPRALRDVIGGVVDLRHISLPPTTIHAIDPTISSSPEPLERDGAFAGNFGQRGCDQGAVELHRIDDRRIH